MSKTIFNVNPNEKQSQSQNARILAYMQKGGRITSLEALARFNCLRLSARIKDLRDKGYRVCSQMIKLKNGKRVKQYFMEVEHEI